jgi:hypothetical protein
VEETLFDCPPMELLHSLLAPAGEVNAISTELMVRAGIEKNLDEFWFELNRKRDWELLYVVENKYNDYANHTR